MDQTDVWLDDIELATLSQIKEILDEYTRLVARGFNLIAKALELERQLQSPSNSRLVTTHLLGRLSNDLRCIVMLAECGYAMQAASLAACAFESGITVAYIGSDDTRADIWQDHDDFKSWGDIKVYDLLKGSLQKVSPPDGPNLEQNTLHIYDCVYRPVAAAKHSNPVIQMMHSNDPKMIDSANATIMSEASLRIAKQSLLTAVFASIMALIEYIKYHLKMELGASLLEFVQELKLDYLRVVQTHNEGK